MKKNLSKIALFLLLGAILYSCSLVKRVPEGQHLLIENTVMVDGKKEKSETILNQLYQKPNSSILGYRLRLQMYNLARKSPEADYQLWLEKKPKRHKFLTDLLSEKQVQRLGQSFFVSGASTFLKKTGEAPVIIDSTKVQKSRNRMLSYYFNAGYFNNKITYKIDTLPNKRGKVNYEVKLGAPYIVDSITTSIKTAALDSLFERTKNQSLIVKGKQYNSQYFSDERKRIATHFRNNGAYYFQETNIEYDVDTVATNHKAHVDILIDDRTVKKGDSLIKVPFKLYTISEVNIFTGNTNNKNKQKVADSTSYNNFNIYSSDKLNYRPKAITDAIFITKGSKFSDFRRQLTSRSLSNLRVFNYPNIEYEEDKNDTTGTSLIANIILSPRKKFNFNATADFMHSNIQDFGILGSAALSIRNIFRGAEILEIALRGNIGSSQDLANPNNVFFNISEYGADVKLSFPRIFFPLNTDKIIPKNTLPTTQMSLGLSRQQNIGLDKESFTGILNYNWNPKRNTNIRFDLVNLQYVRNVNPGNYFSVYHSSYDRLNGLAQVYNTDPTNLDEEGNLSIPQGTTGFINEVLGGQTSLTPNDNDYYAIRSIEERRLRLTENNLILATNITYTKSSRTNINDNDFYTFKTKLESAGNVLSLISKIENQEADIYGRKKFFNVEYSQYIKGEIDFIKNWDLGGKQVIAARAFTGLAIPYGNSNSIPFSRSYFGGGSNDNRAWQSYSLGPGRSGGLNDFNEANFKIALSAEYRFNIFNKLNGAFFADAGNIWNVFDNVTDEESVFEGFKSLQDIALGTGIGFRYDLNFFVIRLDVGFKTYNPAKEMKERWFRDIVPNRAVLNIGINYPF
ncbi:BamA/TamA family outer membrane protein [Flavobacterium sp. CAU 1735]|uniref:translocation and assembly module lipoprotein TamL n=1 Tax=Flavobacterium sp. CAU 1735 TaxID=3140361 RepID=UPI0032607883